MQQYQRNAPARRLTYSKSVVFKLWLAVLVVTGMLALTQTAFADLLLEFDQSGYGRDVWIQIKGSDATFIAYMANDPEKTTPIPFGSNVMSPPYKVSDIMNAGGLNVQFAAGAGLFVFYDNPTNNDRTLPPEMINSAIPSYGQRWQEFELTMTGVVSDQGDLTAIDCFTAPLSITSYDADGNRLQGVGWSANASKVGQQLKQFATLSYPPTPTAVAVAKNAQGKIYRYIGPSKFNPANDSYTPMPWSSFIPYTQAIYAAAPPTTPITTHIYRQNSFLATSGTNYTFGADMDLTAKADGSLSITSKITASANAPDGNLPSSGYWENTDNPWTISAADPDSFNFAIYDQSRAATAVQINKNLSPYTDFKNFCDITPGLGEAGAQAYDTTLNMIVGEVTGAILFGFANSTVLYNDTPIGQMNSEDWWTMNPLKAFSDAQPGHPNPPFYSPYGDVIYKNSNNGVYGAPYSDRFKQASNNPLVNSVQYNGTPVATWVIGIGAPLPQADVTPAIMLLLNN
jgi:hypothetical protein